MLGSSLAPDTGIQPSSGCWNPAQPRILGSSLTWDSRIQSKMLESGQVQPHVRGAGQPHFP